MRVFGSFGSDAIPLFHILIGPDVNHLVKRTDVGVPESGQRGILLPMGQGLAECFLKIGHGSRFHIVGTDFVNHGISFSALSLLPFTATADNPDTQEWA
ncbi:MAG: hypothetical protein CMJ45_11685 [Planctomyces sp.]|nr:hypothetical protein [Planctomyces sp.]